MSCEFKSPYVSRRMYGLGFERQRRWTHSLALVIWLWLLAATPPRGNY